MNFPEINGVDEGTLLYFLLCMYAGYYGSEEAWLHPKTTMFGLFKEPISYGNVFLNIVRIVLPFFGVLALYQIYIKRNLDHFKEIWDLKYFIAHITFYPVSLLTYHVAMIYSPNQIWLTNNRAV